jgi:transcriptional regulator with XRE-family HTH domain
VSVDETKGLRLVRVEELVGARIREKRDELGWSQQELGEKVGEYLGRPWSRQAVSLAEKGQREFGVADLLTLAMTLGVPPIWLMLPSPSPDDPAHAEVVEVGMLPFKREDFVAATLMTPGLPPEQFDEGANQYLRSYLELIDKLVKAGEEARKRLEYVVLLATGHAEYVRKLVDDGYGIRQWEDR